MIKQEKDRIQCAIRHIQTATDVDPWAVEIAVDAMEKQIPRKAIGDHYYSYALSILQSQDSERTR